MGLLRYGLLRLCQMQSLIYMEWRNLGFGLTHYIIGSEMPFIFW